jgi:hypothetical protein
MTLKIIEWFLAIIALIKRFAGGAAKLAHTMGVIGCAVRALNGFLRGKAGRTAYLLPR